VLTFWLSDLSISAVSALFHVVGNIASFSNGDTFDIANTIGRYRRNKAETEDFGTY
jgi:hypothetical protein